MIYFKKVRTKYAELIKNVNITNNQVYYDDYSGCRFDTDITNVVIEKILISGLDIIYLF